MSGYRRGPNVSQYIANLNNPSMDTSPTSDFLQDDSLGTFDFSTEFFDFDMAQNVPFPNSEDNEVLLNSDFAFNDFTFPADLNNSTPTANVTASPTTLFPNPLQTRSPTTTTPRQSTSTSTSSGPKAGDKRKLDALQSTDPQAAAAEAARVAAEEDKRRRNTAASARFRIKKKQREQELEKRAKDMTEKAAMLETKVQQLEMENKWLKGLITEKTVGGSDDDDGSSEGGSVGSPVLSVGVRTSKRELDELWRKHQAEQGQEKERSGKRVKSERA